MREDHDHDRRSERPAGRAPGPSLKGASDNGLGRGAGTGRRKGSRDGVADLFARVKDKLAER